MSESVLQSLSSEADHAGAEPDATQDAGASDAGTSAAPAGNGKADAGVSAGESGQGAGGEHRDSNPADAGQGKLVPLAALHESREKIRALTSQIEELRKQPSLSSEDLELLKDLKAQRTAAKEPKVPDFVEDPKGYIDAKEQRVAEALKKLEDGETKRSEVEQQQQQVQQLVATISSHETKFRETAPDYPDALQHVRTVRTNQLRLLFPQATDAQISAQIGREELSAAHQILQAGGNPVDFAYPYAKTLGYQPKQQQKAPANGTAAPDKDAVRTLGGGGGAETEEEEGDPMPELTAAIKERFTRKRK